MDLTVRQLQRVLHQSKKNPGALLLKGNEYSVVTMMSNMLSGRRLTMQAAIKDGHIWSVRGTSFGPSGAYTHRDVHRTVDSWCRKYGPNMLVKDVLSVEAAQQQLSQDSGGNQGNQGGQAGQSADGGQASAAEVQAAQQAAANAAFDDMLRRRRAEMVAQTRDQQAQNAAARAKAAAEQLAAAQKAVKDARRAPKTAKCMAARKAQHMLKAARRAVSFDRAAAESAPSLEARRVIAQSHGRLRSVPVALRVRIATIINRLVGTAGAAGGNVSTIPVYDSRRLVKRMLVKRPLANALKEDVISGRPVTLFLPDISPSCARQAQAACDMANAAGYAGVSGSDVLVLPHSNGCIEGHADEYIPWFNGKPVGVRGEALINLFNAITTGRSAYKIKVVVAIGDHDAVDMYAQLAAIRRVTQLVWLHNSGPRRAKLANGDDFSGLWPEESCNKLKLVYGCHNQNQMLRGLDLVIQ